MNLCVVGVSSNTNKKLCKKNKKNTHTNLGGHTHHEVTETHSLDLPPKKRYAKERDT